MPKAVNKVVYGGNTIIDLTSDTVDASSLEAGVTAHDASGQPITGTLRFSTIYTGSSVPSASLGSNGDIYIKTS